MIYDSFLTEVAKSINGETSGVISYGLVSTDEVSLATNTIVVSGEIGSRFSFNPSRTGLRVTWDGIRSGAGVTSSDGDVLKGFASVVSSSVGSSGDFGWGFVLPNLVHTSNFDLNVVSDIRVIRG